MTEKQEVLVATIRQFVKENGFAPTVRELADMLEWGHGTVQRALEDLAQTGKIEKRERTARGFRIRGL
jgi:DNA-binding transcriptional regulator YhcF (GntR family)